MPELYRNDFMTVTAENDVVALVWTREEPNDDHAVETARAINRALDENVKTHPNDKWRVLVDLSVVKRNFPRATIEYTRWLLSNRAHVRGGAFATGSFLLRAGISTAVLVPGLTMKGFANVADARKFIATL